MIWSPQDSIGRKVETSGFTFRDRLFAPFHIIEFELTSIGEKNSLRIMHSDHRSCEQKAFFAWSREFQTPEDAKFFAERLIQQELLKIQKARTPNGNRRSRQETG